jgi:hypothetical protein
MPAAVPVTVTENGEATLPAPVTALTVRAPNGV